jgi:hypothetical protein
MDDSVRASFGDHVRIRSTPETEAAGVAGAEGHVHGFTTPSVTGVPVIGVPTDDFALNVFFEDRGESLWFAADLVQALDHAPGSEIRLKGVPKRWVRDASGEWTEHPDPPGDG